MSTRSLMKRNESFPSLFDDFFKPWSGMLDNGRGLNNMMNMPAVNIRENDEGYIVSLAAPGLKKEDFQIDVEGNMITISCEKEQTNEENSKEKFTRKEYNYASFSRSFTLPDVVDRDKIGAKYNDGILEVNLPIKEETKKALATKKINVQ